MNEKNYKRWKDYEKRKKEVLFRKWKEFGTYIIRIELRKGPRPVNPIYYVAKEAGEKIDLMEKYEQMINQGIEVAYFIELAKRPKYMVIEEIVKIVKTIYDAYFLIRERFIAKYTNNEQGKHQGTEGQSRPNQTHPRKNATDDQGA